jgi:hypothetical protein
VSLAFLQLLIFKKRTTLRKIDLFPSLGENMRKHVTISVRQKELFAITVQHMSVCVHLGGGGGAAYRNKCEGPEEGRIVGGNKNEQDVS